MIAIVLSSLVGQLAIVILILWVIFRVARKVGYRRGWAWSLVSISLLLAVIGHLGDDLLGGYLLNSVRREFRETFKLNLGELVALTVVHFAFSPFTLSVIPLLYCSFRKWPHEIREKDVDVFG